MSNVMPSVMINISTSISHNPRVRRKADNSFFDFLNDCKKAEVPERKTNVGAHRCVIQRVANNAGVVVCRLRGSSMKAGA